MEPAVLSPIVSPRVEKQASRRVQRAWCFYDWANSVYSLVIATTIFPLYFASTAGAAAVAGQVRVLGFGMVPAAAFSYTLSAAFLTVALLSPMLSGLADAAGRRKQFLQGFCYLGAASCAGLFFFTASSVGLGLLFFYLATVGFCGSQVFYNAYLPSLAVADKRDALSARGFMYGYIGSVILQITVLLPILMPDWFGGIEAGLASRLAFVVTGLWWAGFAQITFRGLPADRASGLPAKRALRYGLLMVRGTFRRIKARPVLGRFLVAYLFYNMGVQTIMYLASLFGAQELHLPDSALIATILVLQLVAIPGAILTARASGRFGNVPTLMALLVVWIGVCVGAYYTYSQNQFYVLAAVVGLMMGGIQSLSRSTWAKMIPTTERGQTSYFSFQDLTEKVSIVVGTAAYGLVAQATGSMRLSALMIGVFFVVGLGLLGRARK